MVGIASSAADEARSVFFIFFVKAAHVCGFFFSCFFLNKGTNHSAYQKRSSGCSDSSEGENPFYLAFLYGIGFSKTNRKRSNRSKV